MYTRREEITTLEYSDIIEVLNYQRDKIGTRMKSLSRRFSKIQLHHGAGNHCT